MTLHCVILVTKGFKQVIVVVGTLVSCLDEYIEFLTYFKDIFLKDSNQGHMYFIREIFIFFPVMVGNPWKSHRHSLYLAQFGQKIKTKRNMNKHIACKT